MSDVLIDRPELEGLGVYEFGWHDPDAAGAGKKYLVVFQAADAGKLAAALK